MMVVVVMMMRRWGWCVGHNPAQTHAGMRCSGACALDACKAQESLIAALLVMPDVIGSEKSTVDASNRV